LTVALKRETRFRKKRGPWGSNSGLWHFYSQVSLKGSEIARAVYLDHRAVLLVNQWILLRIPSAGGQSVLITDLPAALGEVVERK
jgi:hypothetical protein